MTEGCDTSNTENKDKDREKDRVGEKGGEKDKDKGGEREKERERDRDSVVMKIQGLMRGAVMTRKYHKDALPHLVRYALHFTVLYCTASSRIVKSRRSALLLDALYSFRYFSSISFYFIFPSLPWLLITGRRVIAFHALIVSPRSLLGAV